jgi:osmotically-inducible protein OsmY
MNPSNQFQLIIWSLLAVVLLSSCAGMFTGEGVEEEPRDDVRVAMKVKAELIKVPDLDAAAIHVEASEGVVQLSGFVEKESQRQLARTAAQRVPGVKQVKNRIEVK